MENKEENTSNVNVKPYAVLFIDLMGQTDFFSEFNEVLKDNLVETKPAEISKDLQGKVNKITETINNLAKKQSAILDSFKSSKDKIKEYLKGYSESAKFDWDESKLDKEAEFITKLEFKSQQFSDTIVWYISLENAIVAGSIIELWLAALSSMMIELLSEETPIRGLWQLAMDGK